MYLQAESTECLFKSPLAGGGGLLCRPHYKPHNLLISASKVHWKLKPTERQIQLYA